MVVQVNDLELSLNANRVEQIKARLNLEVGFFRFALG